jgi:hypothetical protein
MKKTHEKLVRQIYRKAKKRTRAQIWQKDVILCLYVLPDQGFISIYLSAAVLLEPNPLTRPDVSLKTLAQAIFAHKKPISFHAKIYFIPTGHFQFCSTFFSARQGSDRWRQLVILALPIWQRPKCVLGKENGRRHIGLSPNCRSRRSGCDI